MEFYMETRIYLAMACEAQSSDAINLRVLMYFYINIFILGDKNFQRFEKKKIIHLRLSSRLVTVALGTSQPISKEFTHQWDGIWGGGGTTDAPPPIGWNRKRNVERPQTPISSFVKELLDRLSF